MAPFSLSKLGDGDSDVAYIVKTVLSKVDHTLSHVEHSAGYDVFVAGTAWFMARGESLSGNVCRSKAHRGSSDTPDKSSSHRYYRRFEATNRWATSKTHPSSNRSFDCKISNRELKCASCCKMSPYKMLSLLGY
jgi:hypothetical protein